MNKEEFLKNLDAVLLEANHDVQMLTDGSYPERLKRRILSGKGHLSNDACSCELPNLIRQGTTRLFLAHLSKDNNSPELAYITAQTALTEAGMTEDVDFILRVAPRTALEPVMVF